MDLVLTDTETGYHVETSYYGVSTSVECDKIVATNPEKALENIRKKLSQWGDTIYNPINIDIRLSQPYLIPASVLGELKRGLLSVIARSREATKQSNLTQTEPVQVGLPPVRSVSPSGLPRRCGYLPSVGEPFRGSRNDASAAEVSLPDEIPTHLMTCHHCIRYANGMCPKVTGKPTGPLYIRNGENIFPLEFDCKNCLMYVCKPE